MSAPRAEEVPLGVECAWPATPVRTPVAPRPLLRASIALAVFLLGAVGAARLAETVWRDARHWLSPALTSITPSRDQPDRGGERASQG
ncbi:MAG TPA: hypothetical protein VIS77_03790 [Burkholderiales bacterium]